MNLDRIKRLSPLLTLGFFLLALWIVHRELEGFHFHEIRTAVQQVPATFIVVAVVLTLLSYLTLAGYDFLGLRYLGKTLPWKKVLLASFSGFAVSNNTGHSLISGPSVRYQFYSADGIEGWDILRLSAFLSLMYLLGVISLAVFAYLLLPGGSDTFPGSAGSLIPWVMDVSIVALIGFWGVVLVRKQPIQFRSLQFTLPSPSLTAWQTLIAVFDQILAALVLYVFLLAFSPVSFTHVLVAFLFAQVIGLYSQVPGGLGIFEGMFMLLMGDQIAKDGLVAALVLYRMIYFWLPLLAAGIALLAYGWRRHSRKPASPVRLANAILANTVPYLFAILLMVSGTILLVSGSTPADPDMMPWLVEWMPLPVIELSHFLGSLVGVLLLLLARAVRLRVDAAYYGGLLLLIAGVMLSLFKGFDWQEASFLLLMFLMFLPTRRFFYRRSSLLQVSFTPGWLMWVAILLAGSTWLGFFAYKHVEYAHDLWWQFSYEGDASRFLRSLIAVVGVLGVYAFLRLSGVHRRQPGLPTEADLPELARIARQSNQPRSHLALLRDKSLIFDDQHRSYIMYGTSRQYWVAVGDPVGNEADFESLVWRFRETADLQGARIAFYQVTDRYLPMYLDMGLILIKLGEEARVSLPDFSLEGRRRANLRHGFNKVKKTGVTFELLEPAAVGAHLEVLQQVSDEWIASKSVREKRFSLGFFDPGYLQHTPVGILRLDGHIVAFANVWTSNDRSELSVDLMRYVPSIGGGVMEYLLVSLMLWGREQGYAWFNLGMAPLAGLERHPLAPLWHRLGNLIFEHGDELYNFEGLHDYKDKFAPQWRPSYLAAPPGLRVPRVLLSVTRMISGGSLLGTFLK